MTAPPQFIQRLCVQLTDKTSAQARLELDVVGGHLIITASWLAPTVVLNAPSMLNTNDPSITQSILVTIAFQKPAAIDLVRNIVQLGLSPLQGRIAMFAATGGNRIGCAAHHAVSKEALKKHLREIYASSRCADWQELALMLRA